MVIAYFIYILIGLLILIGMIFVLKIVFFPIKIITIVKYIKAKKYPQAIKIAKKIIAKNPNNTEAYYLLGKCHLRESKLKLAMEEFRRVDKISIFSEICPELEFRESYAKLLLQNGQAKEALNQYLILIHHKTGNALYYFEAAKILEKFKKYDKAIEFYNNVIKLDSTLEEAFLRVGDIFYQKKQFREAKEIFIRLLQLNQDNTTAAYFMGLISKEKGDFSTALNYLKRAKFNDEYKNKVLLGIGICYVMLGNYQEAAPYLKRAIKLSEENKRTEDMLDAFYYLSLVYEKANEYEAAIKLWQRIFKYNSAYKDVRDKLDKFQQLRSDDRINDYITASHMQFVSICRKLLSQYNFKFKNIANITGGCEVVVDHFKSEGQFGSSEQKKLVWFLRIPETITESTARSFWDKMKELGCPSGMIFSSSDFSSKTKLFASSRPIDLVNARQIQNHLENFNIS